MRARDTWAPVAQVVDALDAAFYLAFENAPRRASGCMLALDVSGSMGPVLGMEYLTAVRRRRRWRS